MKNDDLDLKVNQLKAIEKLRNGNILKADVGAGKSRTALGYYWYKICCCGENKIDLVVITTAKKRNEKDWEAEASLIPMEKYGCKMYVDSWNNITKYLDMKYKNAFFIFDEQRAVGYGTWGKTFIKIGRTHRFIMLTATPGDCWMDYMPIFCANGFFKNKGEFIRRHVIPKPYIDHFEVDKYVDEHILEARLNYILVCMDDFRETEPIEVTHAVPYNTLLYNKYIKTRWDDFDDCPISSPGRLCSLLRRCCGVKEERLREACRLAHVAGKSIIFYNYNYELENLIGMFGTLNMTIDIAQYNGRRHDPIPDSEAWVYLVQYNAGAEGWNCTKTDTIIFYSDNYSYKIMEQAKGRINRMNTPFNKLYYHRFISQAPIEKRIRNCINEKKIFNENLYKE